MSFVPHTNFPASILIGVRKLSYSLVGGVTISNANATGFATSLGTYLQIVRLMAKSYCN